MQRVSAIADEMGIGPDPSLLHTIQIAVADAEAVRIRDFWIAALGYEEVGGLDVDA